MRATLRRDLGTASTDSGTVQEGRLWKAKFIGSTFYIYEGDRWAQADSNDFDLMADNPYPNGFRSWMETFFDIVWDMATIQNHELKSKLMEQILEEQGRGGLYDLAENMTDEFEAVHEGRKWDGDYNETINEYIKKKLK